MIEKIPYTAYRYKTDDGKIFDDENDAIRHEKILQGKIKVCEWCDGKGSHLNEDYKFMITCQSCNGSGYLTKQEVWK